MVPQFLKLVHDAGAQPDLINRNLNRETRPP
jgi:hypothetical protein